MESRFSEFDLVIFDADGTLYDTVYFYVETYYQLYKQHGLIVPRAHIHKHVGMGSDKALARLCPPEWLSQHAETIAKTGKPYYIEHYLNQVEMFPCAKELLALLRQLGKKCALASMSNSEVVKHYVSLAGEGAVYDYVTSSCDVERTKPDPDIFIAVCDAFPEIVSDRVCVVGDSVWDMQAAKSAGLYAIGVLCGGYAECELIRAGADEVYADPKELYSVL